jgi:serine/threonine protein kinase
LTRSNSKQTTDYTTQLVGRTTFIVSGDGESVHFDNGVAGSADYKVGDIVGDTYKLIAQLGRGGMGVVYTAEHLTFGQQYALKLLAPEQTSDVVWQRFKIEGQVLAKLDHQNIVKIYNMGVDKGGCPYYVMALLRGAALADVTAHLPVRPQISDISADRKENSSEFSECSDFTAVDILKIYSQVCAGLSVAHGKGIIHRDIKPGNIIVTGPVNTAGSIKIVDFGLAALTTNDRTKQSLTMAGEVFGSPLFMSPEQSLGEKVDHRSDIYSLGCSLYQSLTGRPPFIGGNALETLIMHQQNEIPSLAEAAFETVFSPELEVLVARLLEKDPAERYQSIDLVRQDIERVLAGKNLSLRAKSALPEKSFSINSTGGATLGGGVNISSFVFILVGVVLLWSTFGLVTLIYNNNYQQNISKQQRFKALLQATKPKLSADDEAVLGPELPNETADIKASEIQKYAVELTDTSKIAPVTVSKNGHAYRRIVFPSDIKYGSIHYLNGSVDAKGETLVPLEKGDLSFIAAPPALCYPPLFEKFKDENFQGLSIQHSTPILPVEQVVAMAADWPKLYSITFDECDLGSFDFSCLSKLKHLNNIEVMETTFDTDNLAAWPGLPKLHVFKFSGISHTDKLLGSVFRAPNMEKISLAKTTITPEILALLGGNPAVSSISFRECKLDNASIAQVLSAPNLQEIYIAEPKVDQRILETLKRFPKLKHISITAYHTFSAVAINQFKQVMPNTQCDFEQNQFFGRP